MAAAIGSLQSNRDSVACCYLSVLTECKISVSRAAMSAARRCDCTSNCMTTLTSMSHLLKISATSSKL